VLIATLSTNHAKPFGPELQVKRMLGRRRFRGAKIINREQK